MTYCLAIKLEEGLVFCSDSRTNAGPDQVDVYSKQHIFLDSEDRQMVLLSAGNLATTQAVVSRMGRDLAEHSSPNIHDMHYLSDVADYVGQISQEVQKKYAPDGPKSGFNPKASFILGGQIKGSEPELFLIYPEGNHIQPSRRNPFFQIGETKYGKPILDRILEHETPHEIAMRCALVSMDSTIRSSATVGPPIEIMYLKRDQFGGPAKSYSLTRNDPYLVKLRETWNQNLLQAFSELPSMAEMFEGD
ncbi:MAG: 20S proteasome subunit A/B [Xanthomonadales bacterium]|nr:20S proteasome subunit A/B [Xanthomonadales bacterium]